MSPYVGNGGFDFWRPQKNAPGTTMMNQKVPPLRMISIWVRYGVPERVTAVAMMMPTHTITAPVR